MNMYQEELLDHYWHPKNRGNTHDASFSATEHNPLCGDTLTITARVEHDILADIKFNGNGCAISQAAADLLTESLAGKTIQNAGMFSPDAMRTLLNVPISGAREKCALLALTAFQKGLNDYAHN
ncbi:MAG TPA: Fe-S cluster protein [Candidatus Magasanikbacteria bacterium]|uniref:SUF system FeS assembly protein, NifU family n=1 Tax=Candidatus Magasanikbacteria bacterium GW2011_GWA2_45_39 TaxID=1619041 RepID=A0A0G1QGP8_9BACT|nr:MAG: SUF system FeS assembly protein, NifU family [Candidatus Magasanikbacteria bacterium GW2011_GWA2_45_39]HBV58019.1 Fe-S cluster protein [Candidatus Magasanikbacteria bacterium]HBW74075.1 Fe-S cluster protein [Candidatus Magasanikbacteria bacterium]